MCPAPRGMSHWHGTAQGKGGILSRERMPPLNPPRERQGRFDFAPAPLTTKREGPCPSFLDYPPRSSDGTALLRSPFWGAAFLVFRWVGTAVVIADGFVGNDVV